MSPASCGKRGGGPLKGKSQMAMDATAGSEGVSGYLHTPQSQGFKCVMLLLQVLWAHSIPSLLSVLIDKFHMLSQWFRGVGHLHFPDGGNRNLEVNDSSKMLGWRINSPGSQTEGANALLVGEKWAG